MHNRRTASDRISTGTPAGAQRLNTPRTRSLLHGVHVDPEAAGRISERIARYFGTVRYLAIQTVIVAAWIILNVTAVRLRWDPYPFILLNLAFSTQAAYAAPLILLAQNRQENRERVSLAEDRVRAAQTKADTEFLARELAALRLAVGEVATRDYIRREIDQLRRQIEEASPAGRPRPETTGDPVSRDGSGNPGA